MDVNRRVAEAEEIDDIGQLIEKGNNSFFANYVWEIDGMELKAPIPFYEKAIKLAQESGESDKEHKARMGLGSYLAWIAQYEAALIHVERAVELNPTDFDSRRLLATVYRNMGRNEEASQQSLEADKIIERELIKELVSIPKKITNYFSSSHQNSA